MTLPYVTASPVPPFGVFGWGLIAATIAGVAAAWITGRRLALATGELLGLAAVCGGAALIGAHAFDVLWYQSDAAHDPGVWLRITDGVSLFGALLAGGIAAAVWMIARELDMAAYTDALAIGSLVALTIGRIGCALVHDHPGVPTTLPIGIDFPGNVRLHDLGFEELALLVPLTLVSVFLFGLRVQPGSVAAFSAIAYAGMRFGLDFLRSPTTEPTVLGLTAGQFGSIGLALATIVALVLRARRGPGRKGRRSTIRVRLPSDIRTR